MDTQDTFVPTSEQWNEAYKTAYDRNTSSEFPAVAAPILGFFGGGIVAMMTLLLAGLDPQVFPASAAMMIVATGCGAIGYFFFRAKKLQRKSCFEKFWINIGSLGNMKEQVP